MIGSVYEERKVRRKYYADMPPSFFRFLSALFDIAALVAAMFILYSTVLLSAYVGAGADSRVQYSKPVPLHHHTTHPATHADTHTHKLAHYTWYVDQCLGRVSVSRVTVCLQSVLLYDLARPLLHTSRVLSSSLHVCSRCPPILSHPLLSIPHLIHLTELTDVAAPHTFHSTILLSPFSPPLAIRFTPTRPILPLPSHPRCRNANVIQEVLTVLTGTTVQYSTCPLRTERMRHLPITE